MYLSFVPSASRDPTDSGSHELVGYCVLLDTKFPGTGYRRQARQGRGWTSMGDIAAGVVFVFAVADYFGCLLLYCHLCSTRASVHVQQNEDRKPRARNWTRSYWQSPYYEVERDTDIGMPFSTSVTEASKVSAGRWLEIPYYAVCALSIHIDQTARC